MSRSPYCCETNPSISRMYMRNVSIMVSVVREWIGRLTISVMFPTAIDTNAVLSRSRSACSYVAFGSLPVSLLWFSNSSRCIARAMCTKLVGIRCRIRSRGVVVVRDMSR